jgi:carboxypeptidase C (cathepsin A)
MKLTFTFFLNCLVATTFATSTPSPSTLRDLSAVLESGGNVFDAAIVGPLPGINATSYSGFFTVNKTANANHFFWYFPALNGNVSAPVIVFMQGGP